MLSRYRGNSTIIRSFFQIQRLIVIRKSFYRFQTWTPLLLIDSLVRLHYLCRYTPFFFSFSSWARFNYLTNALSYIAGFCLNIYSTTLNLLGIVDFVIRRLIEARNVRKWWRERPVQYSFLLRHLIIQLIPHARTALGCCMMADVFFSFSAACTTTSAAREIIKSREA